MLNILYVGLGGFIGAILRYLVYLSSNYLLGSKSSLLHNHSKYNW